MPSRKKDESAEAFRERARLYMERRAIGRGRQPIRRKLPKEHSPHAGARIHYKVEDWQRRLEFREQVGFWPERLRASELDDAALVAALRRERRR